MVNAFIGSKDDGTNLQATLSDLLYSSTLVMGPVALLNGTLDLSAGIHLLLVEIPKKLCDFAANTLKLELCQRWPVSYKLVAIDGTIHCTGSCNLDQMLHNMAIGETFKCDVARHFGGGNTTIDGYAPLFFIFREERSNCLPNSETGFHIFSQIEYDDSEILFIRTSDTPVVGSTICLNKGEEEPSVRSSSYAHVLFAEAMRLHSLYGTALNNHRGYFTRCFPGQELEHKITISEPVDIWALAVAFYGEIKNGEMGGFIPAFKEEFHCRDFQNHMLEIIDPPADLGYVSFIPEGNGLYSVKRKRFSSDQLVRGEQVDRNIPVEGPFEDYIFKRYGLNAYRQPSFRRVSYDLRVESTQSGNIFEVLFDVSSINDSSKCRLIQCEIEYVKSRTIRTPDEGKVLEELKSLLCRAEAFLTNRGIEFNSGFYSKLTFLKEHGAPQA